MSSVLDAKALQESPLADLHVLANELGVDGFRRLRKPQLVEAIIARHTGEAPTDDDASEAPAASSPLIADAADPALDTDGSDEEANGADDGADSDAETSRRGRRSRRGSRTRSRGREEDNDSADVVEPTSDEPGAATVEGVVELLANGSGFLRLSPPEPSDDDVYVSAAQVKRCELVNGDRVVGPVRRPRNSERFPSLVRVDMINGRPADEVAEGTRYEDRAARFPFERLAFSGDDSTVKEIERLAPIGRGSRVSITGTGRGGKTEALRRLAQALSAQPELELILVLAGIRPEELADWKVDGLPAPVATVLLGASAEAQAQAVEQAIEQGRRVAARGAHAVVLIDTLEQLPAPAARRALAMARAFVDGGSLTVLATAASPLGGETTVVALDASLVARGKHPALDLALTGTMRAELLVGEDGARAIFSAREAAR